MGVCVTYGGTMGVCDIWGGNGVCVRDLHLGHCEAHTGRVELRDELVDLGWGVGMGVGVVGWG